MTIRFVEDIYADFLFDCYIANQHLTDEDWLYYGREEHHIEVPNRDGGVLTPLNSQSLTVYQHWIAGVLQSEVLSKCCFACVPTGVLPPMFETLRRKWASHQGKQQQPPHPSGVDHPRYGKKHTPQARRKMSEKKKGKPQPHLLTPEAINKSRRSNQKPVEITFPSGRVGVYPSVLLAATALGVDRASIIYWAKNKGKSSLGVKVRYF